MSDMQPIYVRMIRAPEVFDVSQATLYRWAAKGAIRIYKRGSASFLKLSEVSAYIEGLGDHMGD